MIYHFKNIAISGSSGTGKTTLANNLAKVLGFKHLNNGDFVRGWYKEHNIDLNKVTKIPEEVDRKIDTEFQTKMNHEENTIFESRLAGWQARDLSAVFKILCIADQEEALKRVSKRDKSSKQEAIHTIQTREDGLAKKFFELYGVINYLDPKYFDLVVDTTSKTSEEVLKIVLAKLKIIK